MQWEEQMLHLHSNNSQQLMRRRDVQRGWQSFKRLPLQHS
jgi:hypothetical protein